MYKMLLISHLKFINCRSANIRLNSLRMSFTSNVKSLKDTRLWKEERGVPKVFIVAFLKAEASCFGTRMQM